MRTHARVGVCAPLSLSCRRSARRCAEVGRAACVSSLLFWVRRAAQVPLLLSLRQRAGRAGRRVIVRCQCAGGSGVGGGGGAAALLARCGGCRCPCRYTPASKMRARPCAAQYPAHRGPVFGPAFAWRHRRAFVWFSVSRFKHGVPNPFFLAFCHGTRFEMMAILVKALKCVTKRLRAFP